MERLAPNLHHVPVHVAPDGTCAHRCLEFLPEQRLQHPRWRQDFEHLQVSGGQCYTHAMCGRSNHLPSRCQSLRNLDGPEKMGSLSPLLNLFHGAELDAGREVLVLFGMAWLKEEADEAGAAVYVQRFRRDNELIYGHHVALSEWSESGTTMRPADVAECAPPPSPLPKHGR